MLSRSGCGEHNPQRENTQQQQYHRANFTRIDRFHRQPREHNQQGQGNPLPRRRSRRPNVWLGGDGRIRRVRCQEAWVHSHAAALFEGRRALVQISTPQFHLSVPTSGRLWYRHACDAWCTGEDSNLRSSKERQIYSLLPLTARPPVHNRRPGRIDSRSEHKLRHALPNPIHTTHSADVFPRSNWKGRHTSLGMITAGYSGSA
jgi:hypothetical protein